MRNKKIFFLVLSSLAVLMFGSSHIVYAEGESVNFSIIDNGAVVFSGDIPLPPSGVISISDTDGNMQGVDARSVLNIVKNADELSSDFNISQLIYYSSFSAFYLKCINIASELCDGWMYKVNGESGESGMDQNILSGGEEVKLFFGSDEPETSPHEEETENNEDIHTSSGGLSGSRAVVKKEDSAEPDIQEVQKVENIALVEVTPEKKEEVKKIIKPAPKKVVQVKKVVNPIVGNTASVISSLNEDVEVPKVQKTSWVKKFISWLFWF